MTFEHLDSAIVYRARAFAVRQDRFRLPDGRESIFDIIQHHGAVTLVPVDAEGHLWFVRQFRPAAGQELLEFPAGTLEPNEAVEVCAAREIREEIGMAAGRLTPLGEFFLAPGYSTEYMYVFLAEDLHPAPLTPDDDEFLSVERLPVATVEHMIRRGELHDAKTMLAFWMAYPYLRPHP